MNMWLQDEMFENCFANFGNRLKLRIVRHTVNQKENTKIYLNIKKEAIIMKIATVWVAGYLGKSVRILEEGKPAGTKTHKNWK